MITFLLTIIKLVIVLCIVATVHEFGHFLFSKMFKVGVEEFSIGFGPKIFQKKIKGTMYSLRWIPLGGYCAIEGESGESDSKTSFSNKNLIKKLLILIAGALFNAILAIIIFVSISFAYPKFTTTITEFSKDSALEQAGLKVGDTITSINGKSVRLFSDISLIKVENNDAIEVEYKRDGKTNKVTVNNGVTSIGYIGVQFKESDDKTYVTNEIDMVSGSGVAAENNLKAGDKITSINGVETKTSSDIVKIIRENPEKEIEITYERKGKTETKKIVPKLQYALNLGIANVEQSKPSLKYAISETLSSFSTIFGSYVDLFRGKVGIKDMSGIVGIGEVVSKADGLLEFLNLMAIISLAVGVANVIPLPPLDGGKMLIVTIEAITRKKVSEKTEAIISYIGFGLLILLTLIVTYNDIVRII